MQDENSWDMNDQSVNQLVGRSVVRLCVSMQDLMRGFEFDIKCRFKILEA
jgi:hypothetical protein